MKTILLFTYTVIAQLHHGRLFKIGDPITLTESEAAELADHLDPDSQREADPDAQPCRVKIAAPVENSPDENALLRDRIVELQADLEVANKALATVCDEHDALTTALQETIDTQNFEITALKSEVETLKTKPAKPAAGK